jgi:hypothetical protein
VVVQFRPLCALSGERGSEVDYTTLSFENSDPLQLTLLDAEIGA